MGSPPVVPLRLFSCKCKECRRGWVETEGFKGCPFCGHQGVIRAEYSELK